MGYAIFSFQGKLNYKEYQKTTKSEKAMQTSDPESDMAEILELYQTGHLK